MLSIALLSSELTNSSLSTPSSLLLNMPLETSYSLDDKVILITGGTGSFGNKFVSLTLRKYTPRKIIVFSRDEMKQWIMAQKFAHLTPLSFVIGDVRDFSSLRYAMQGVDCVVHAAATKIVPTAEYNPAECIKTNIDGAMNVVNASRDASVPRVVALSTDKASNPINLYGATKLASDKLFIAANLPFGQQKTRYSVVRYGNVMGSRGSVIPFFRSLANTGCLPITDPRMTRFMISLDSAVELVWHALCNMLGGEIYVKKIPSMLVTDIAKAIAPDATQRIIGIRPGEKIHEQMIGVEDATNTFSYPGHYKVLPVLDEVYKNNLYIQDGIPVGEDFQYRSDLNDDWMTPQSLREWLDSSDDHF